LPEDKIINGLQVMASALANAPQPTSVTNLRPLHKSVTYSERGMDKEPQEH
jgi:hypothetical protein